MEERSTAEKGDAGFDGIRLLLCENPLPQMDEAIAVATSELPRSNLYTEPHTESLRGLLGQRLNVPTACIYIYAGSELILRQLFDRFGEQGHLLTPTDPLFPEIVESYTETRLRPEDGFRFDLRDLTAPERTQTPPTVTSLSGTRPRC